MPKYASLHEIFCSNVSNFFLIFFSALLISTVERIAVLSHAKDTSQGSQAPKFAH